MQLLKILEASVLAASLLFSPLPLVAGQSEISDSRHPVKHVLLISVDGLHALDLSNYVNTHHGSTLALLSRNGVTYTNASTSTPRILSPAWLRLSPAAVLKQPACGTT